MDKFRRAIMRGSLIGLIVSFFGMIITSVASIVARFQHPDMTQIRFILENPEYSIIATAFAILLWICYTILTFNARRK